MTYDIEILTRLQSLIKDKMSADYPVGEFFLLSFMKGKIEWENCTLEQQIDIRTRYQAAINDIIDHAQAFKDDQRWWRNIQ